MGWGPCNPWFGFKSLCPCVLVLVPPRLVGIEQQASEGGGRDEGERGRGGSGGAGVMPTGRDDDAPPPPFPGFAPWIIWVYGTFEDADPRPPPPQEEEGSSAVHRLTFWLYGDAAHAVDPPAPAAQQGCGGCGGSCCLCGAMTPLPAMSDGQLAGHLTAILRFFVEGQREDASGDDDEEDEEEARWIAGALPAGGAAATTSSLVPEPLGLARSRWGSDPLFRGSYSYIAAGASEGDITTIGAPLTLTLGRAPAAAAAAAAAAAGGGDGEHAGAPPQQWQWAAPLDDARTAGEGSPGATPQPLPLPLLAFAGEATHPRFYSATHGAFASGRREAARAAAALRQRQRAASLAIAIVRACCTVAHVHVHVFITVMITRRRRRRSRPVLRGRIDPD